MHLKTLWSINMTNIGCPSCGIEIKLDAKKSKLGEFLSCQECGTRLEVVWLDPIELDFAFEESFFYKEFGELGLH